MKSFPLSLFLKTVCLLPLPLLLAGCGSGIYGCSADVERGIEVVVYDAQTHVPIARDAVGTIQDGPYTETLTSGASDVYMEGAPERPGTYTIHIEKTGYQPWEKKNVRVTKNDCHVNRVTVEADLQPGQ